MIMDYVWMLLSRSPVMTCHGMDQPNRNQLTAGREEMERHLGDMLWCCDCCCLVCGNSEIKFKMDFRCFLQFHFIWFSVLLIIDKTCFPIHSQKCCIPIKSFIEIVGREIRKIWSLSIMLYFVTPFSVEKEFPV